MAIASSMVVMTLSFALSIDLIEHFRNSKKVYFTKIFSQEVTKALV